MHRQSFNRIYKEVYTDWGRTARLCTATLLLLWSVVVVAFGCHFSRGGSRPHRRWSWWWARWCFKLLPLVGGVMASSTRPRRFESKEKRAEKKPHQLIGCAMVTAGWRLVARLGLLMPVHRVSSVFKWVSVCFRSARWPVARQLLRIIPSRCLVRQF